MQRKRKPRPKTSSKTTRENQLCIPLMLITALAALVDQCIIGSAIFLASPASTHPVLNAVCSTGLHCVGAPQRIVYVVHRCHYFLLRLLWLPLCPISCEFGCFCNGCTAFLYAHQQYRS
ncbi:hypothetical protein V8B97DRAFT_779566 [Scleroderma yunnanense]